MSIHHIKLLYDGLLGGAISLHQAIVMLTKNLPFATDIMTLAALLLPSPFLFPSLTSLFDHSLGFHGPASLASFHHLIRLCNVCSQPKYKHVNTILL